MKNPCMNGFRYPQDETHTGRTEKISESKAWSCEATSRLWADQRCWYRFLKAFRISDYFQAPKKRSSRKYAFLQNHPLHETHHQYIQVQSSGAQFLLEDHYLDVTEGIESTMYNNVDVFKTMEAWKNLKEDDQSWDELHRLQIHSSQTGADEILQHTLWMQRCQGWLF